MWKFSLGAHRDNGIRGEGLMEMKLLLIFYSIESFPLVDFFLLFIWLCFCSSFLLPSLDELICVYLCFNLLLIKPKHTM